MRIFEHICDSCEEEHVLDEVAKDKAARGELRCHCGSTLRRLWSAPAVHFNAPGFFSTQDDPGGKGWNRKQRARARKAGQS